MLFSPPSDASWVESLPDGHQGTMRTLEVMRYLVRKDCNSSFVRNTIKQIAYARRFHPGGEIGALFSYARDAIHYVEDPPGVERVRDFQRTTEAGCGDCDDKSVWLGTALCSRGVPARFVVQSYGEEWAHVYLEYWDWDSWQWIALDPTADGHTGITGTVGWRQSLPDSGFEMRFSI